MTIRKAKKKDIEEIMRISAAAKETMRSRGNTVQWAGDYPSRDLWLDDIKKGQAYVVECDCDPVAAFALIFGDDPTYGYIEGGSWPNSRPYATIHRVASDGSRHGIVTAVTEYCSGLASDLRADTHEINCVMRRELTKNGFIRCGTIYLPDGTPRFAYHRICNNDSTEEINE